ncbi:MAG TPA: TlyA family RNA methyltransferase [Thermomicrobiales bacterium]|nr:TlyA family RNA methyltransferase [Thermomicrobiales bacterium]
MAKSIRLDQALVERGLAETRSRAKSFIMAGDILVNGLKETRAGRNVAEADELAFRSKPRFVSRGGEKLDHALTAFGIDVADEVAADLGASTGGFTDCLVQRGISRVYAVDVGYGQIDEKLRTDDRVIVMERENARYLESLPEPIDITVIDVSFISLALIFPVVARISRPGARCVPLIKPQFEAGKGDVGKGGVVRDPAIHRRVIEHALASAIENGLMPEGVVASPLRGPAGNVEFLANLALGVARPSDESLSAMIDQAMAEADRLVNDTPDVNEQPE